MVLAIDDQFAFELIGFGEMDGQSPYEFIMQFLRSSYGAWEYGVLYGCYVFSAGFGKEIKS